MSQSIMSLKSTDASQPQSIINLWVSFDDLKKDISIQIVHVKFITEAIVSVVKECLLLFSKHTWRKFSNAIVFVVQYTN